MNVSTSSVTNLKSKGSPVFAATLLAALLTVGLSACGSKSTIDLQQPPAAPQPPPSEKPSPASPANPNDPANNPEKPDPPAQTGPIVPRYRLVCEGAPQVSAFVTLETTSKSFDPSLILFLGSYADPNEAVTGVHHNIIQANNQILIPGSAQDQVDFLFVGRKRDINGNDGDVRLFQTSADSVLRTGSSTDLGPAPALDKAVRQAADTLSLTPANYGSSDEGHFVLLPVSGGFKVLSRDRSHAFGTIKADIGKTILPKIFESQKVYTALVYNGHGFTPVAQALAFTSNSVSVSKTFSLESTTGTALPLQTYEDGSLVWSETALGGASTITIAKVVTATGRVTRATYRTSVSGAHIYPQMAVINEGATDGGQSGLTINVAVESLTYQPTTEKPGAQVSYAKVQKLTLSSDGSALSEGDTIEYPSASLQRVASLGMRGLWIIKTLFTTENSDELLGTFDATNGYQIFKDRGGFFDGVSENPCPHPAVVEENL